MIVKVKLATLIARMRTAMRAEDGATVLIALGVLTVSSLLVAGSFAAVQSDAPLAQRALDSKRAYYAARSGVNAFLYELNRDPNYWQSCPKQVTKKSIGGYSPGSYTFEPVPANGASSCSPIPPTGGDPIGTLIDTTTGTFQYRFVGYAGQVKRGLIATFRKDTPLDYLWYTIYETLDPLTYDNPANYYDCGWARTPRPPDCVDIVWTSGDDVNGPAYTQDQYMIGNNDNPVFGRPDTNDEIQSAATTTDPNNTNRICASDNCEDAQFRGAKVPNAETISPPPDNDELLADAQRYGRVFTGVTFVNLTGTTATITKCPTLPCTQETITLGKVPNVPIIYVNNATTGCSYSYSPYNPSYPNSGPCGYVYVKGNYTRSLTIAADSDVILEGEIFKNAAAPAPVLGLVANNFVRVKHALTSRPQPPSQNNCGSATNTPGQFLQDPQFDAAILAIKHSFIVDNWDCGQPMGQLEINGAIAQLYRGTVGRGSAGNNIGYLKDYNYDDRLAVAQPPYMFDIANSSWNITRETACVPTGPAASTSCGTPTALP